MQRLSFVLTSSASRATRYRDIAYRLWRISLDQSKDIPFEARRRLGALADELEDLAEAVEDELPIEP